MREGMSKGGINKKPSTLRPNKLSKGQGNYDSINLDIPFSVCKIICSECEATFALLYLLERKYGNITSEKFLLQEGCFYCPYCGERMRNIQR